MSQAQKVPETAVEKQPRKHGCRRGCFGCLGVFILLLPAIWYFCLHTTPLQVSEETTYVLGPMTADGKRVDYFLAMEERYYPPEMKTDDNGYRLLVRACGIKIEAPDPDFYRQQVYEKLGLDPNVKPMLKLESPWKTFEQYSKEHPVENDADNMLRKFQESVMWTLDEFPMLKDWLEENNAGLDLLGEAVRKPAFCIPYIRKDENTPIVESLLRLQATLEFREMARAAAARAKYRIGTGNIDGAIDDIVTIHHLARHTGKYGFLVQWLVGIAIEGYALDIGIASNPDAQPTKAQIERLMAEVNALPPRQTLKEVLGGSERLFALASFQDMYWGIFPFEDFFYVSAPPYTSSGLYWTLDLNIALSRLNETFDILSSDGIAAIDDDFFTPKRTFNPLPLLFTHSRSHKIMDTLAALTVPGIQAANNAERRTICDTNIQRLTLALLLYEKEHNKLPEGDWREAVKPYLGANSEQYFRCPMSQLAKDETAYAMVVGESHSSTTTPFLIVEVAKPQKLGEGDGRIALETMDELSKNHDGFRIGVRSGGVRFLPKEAKPEELKELLE